MKTTLKNMFEVNQYFSILISGHLDFGIIRIFKESFLTDSRESYKQSISYSVLRHINSF